jgi:hypothetical protein
VALFRRRKSAMEQEVRELQAAIVAVCETADSDRSENASIRTRVGLVENQVYQQQRSIVQTTEALARRFETGFASTPLPPPPPPPSARPVTTTGAAARDDATTSSITYLQGLAETVVRATATQAAAMDGLRARQSDIERRMDDVDQSIDTRLTVASAKAIETIEERIDDQIAALRAAQVRLANEQARHEIASRAELAAVVDRFRLANSYD